ncbi:MAG: hypothetical protein IIZ32_04950 [Ruminococcus sp.]|nr:hypothetical protein [Ruminococcus sp.]
MKKKDVIITVILILIAAIAAGWFLFSPVHVSGIGTVVFHYNGAEIEDAMTESESAVIADIVNGNAPYFDSPSCGFDNKIGIRFSGQMISIACDNCPTLSVHGMYFDVSKEEAEQFRSIMRAHGASFPCV